VSNTRDNPPCNTLFIGNLGEAVDDTELSTLFSSQPVRVGVPLRCADRAARRWRCGMVALTCADRV
jgi:hypothetical protein